MHVMQQCIVHCGRVVFFRVFAKKKIKKTRTFMVVGQTFVAGISCATARFAAKSGHREISVSELPLHSAGRGRKGSSVGPLLQPAASYRGTLCTQRYNDFAGAEIMIF